jgi:hypothetical protein
VECSSEHGNEPYIVGQFLSLSRRAELYGVSLFVSSYE